MKQRNKNQQGFTLIELLIVIAIVGLMSSIVMTVLTTTREKARDTRRFADVKQMSTALELYQLQNGTYPISATETESIPGLAPTYITSLPTSPSPAGSGCTDEQNKYLYTSDGTTYSLKFCIGTAITGNSAGASGSSGSSSSSTSTNLVAGVNTFTPTGLAPVSQSSGSDGGDSGSGSGGGSESAFVPGYGAGYTLSGVTWDANNDNVRDTNDPTYISQFVVGIVTVCPLSVCDTSGNGSVSGYDASLLLRQLQGLGPPLPIHP